MAETRRRGEALEAAILDAGWEQLATEGYGGFTFEAIAERARTGKAVLYRRWPDKESLLLAVLEHSALGTPREIPDTGSLRGDLISTLRAMNERGANSAALFSTHLGAFFDASDTTPAQLRLRLIGDRSLSITEILRRAVERGELADVPIPERVAMVPFDLLRGEVLMNLGPVADDTVLGIVDEVFLPLVHAVAGGTAGADTAD